MSSGPNLEHLYPLSSLHDGSASLFYIKIVAMVFTIKINPLHLFLISKSRFDWKEYLVLAITLGLSALIGGNLLLDEPILSSNFLKHISVLEIP